MRFDYRGCTHPPWHPAAEATGKPRRSHGASMDSAWLSHGFGVASREGAPPPPLWSYFDNIYLAPRAREDATPEDLRSIHGASVATDAPWIATIRNALSDAPPREPVRGASEAMDAPRMLFEAAPLNLRGVHGASMTVDAPWTAPIAAARRVINNTLANLICWSYFRFK